MRLSELNDSLVISERKINDINTIKSKMESQLHTMKTRSVITDNLIIFSASKFYLPSGSLKNRNDSLRIIKEGEIVISKEGHSLKISWSVKLDSLYFLALCCSVVAGIATSLYLSLELVVSVNVGIAFFLMFVLSGILYIKYKLFDLIESSVYPNYN